jgi:MoaA/NifB/PqqE/SkfB family radical SAM enzyme
MDGIGRGCSSDGHARLPRKLVFEPTGSCNLECKMCDRSRNAVPELTLPEIRRLVRGLPSSVKEAYISGGEPFLRSDLMEICREFNDRKISVSVQTNGTFPEKAIEIAGLEATNVLMSLDGPAGIHDEMRGLQGSYESTMEIMRFLKNGGKGCVITTVISDDNLSSLPGFPKHLVNQGMKPDLMIVEVMRRFSEDVVSRAANESGVARESIKVSPGKGVRPAYSPEQFRESVSRLKKELDRCRFNYTFYPIDLISRTDDVYNRGSRAGGRLYCSHFNVARIESNGDLVPCFVFRKGFGNLLKDRFQDAWNCRGFMEFRRRMLASNLTSACETCFRAVRVPGAARLIRRGMQGFGESNGTN